MKWPPAGLISFLVPLAIYVASMPPDVSYWDTAELQTVPYIFGIAHPTGFPTFVFAGWFFSHVIPFGTVAWRIGLVSAVAMAAAAYFVYAVVVELGESRLVGTFAALLFALGEVAWTHGTRADAHVLELAFGALAVWSLLRWRRTGKGSALYWAALAYGLALATHGVASLMAGGLALLLFPHIFKTSLRTIAAAAACLILPGLLYLYLPLRSAYLDQHRIDALAALGSCGRDPFWNYGHPATLAALVRYMGAYNAVGSAFHDVLSLDKYPALTVRFLDQAVHDYSLIALLLAAIGFVVLVRSDWIMALGLFLASAASVPFGIVFASDPAGYLLTALWFIAILVGVGTGRAAAALFPRRQNLAAFVAAAVMCGLAGSRLIVNYELFEQREELGARPLVNWVVAQTPDNAVLVARWTYATAFGYVENVEHGLGHRITVIAEATGCKGHYATWLKSRPLYLINLNYPDADFRTTVISQNPTLIKLDVKR